MMPLKALYHKKTYSMNNIILGIIILIAAIVVFAWIYLLIALRYVVKSKRQNHYWYKEPGGTWNYEYRPAVKAGEETTDNKNKMSNNVND